MATYYGTNTGKIMGATVNTGASGTPAPGTAPATVRSYIETVAMTTQTTGDIIYVARLPKGSIFLYGVLQTDTSTGSATIALGISGSTAKYKAAAAFTATDTPTFFGKAAATGVALTQDDDILITIAAASLPSTGNLTIEFVYAYN